MPSYRIVEWDERYEVNKNSRPLKIGETPRSGPLEFVRLTVFGTKMGHGYRKMSRLAGASKTLQVFGLFCKLLEIAADAPHDRRGIVPDPEETADILGVPISQVVFGYDVLEKSGWISRNSANDAEFAEKRLQPTNQPTQPIQDNTTKWESLRGKVRVVVGPDGGVEDALTKIGNTFTSNPDGAEEAAQIIMELLPDVQRNAKQSKPHYFLGMLRKRFPCLAA